jgi:hypothetical protein
MTPPEKCFIQVIFEKAGTENDVLSLEWIQELVLRRKASLFSMHTWRHR